jgi:hypothetical protein
VPKKNKRPAFLASLSFSSVRAGKRGRRATVDSHYNHSSNKATNIDDPCRACGQSDYIIIEEGMHLAKRCRNCGRWSRWLPHTPENLALCEKAPAPKAPPLFALPDPKPSPATCDHRGELDRLIHHMRGIERHLEVVTRALMGQAR